MLVLGIESTCDETACALVKEGKDILSHVVTSQIDLHHTFGGVVPELACRCHVDVLLPVIQEALTQAQVSLNDVDLFAVAHGPGLIGALLIGLNAAKSLALAQKKPFIGVNHVEAHLYAALMSHPHPVAFPCLGVVVSGGHTALVKIHDIGSYQLIAQTVDDAMGEAFDKVAKVMGLAYPGGPKIEAMAREGDAYRYAFKSGRVKGRPLDFSFSGLKTGVLYAVKGQNGQGGPTLTEQDKKDLAASFQRVAFQDLLDKTLQAAEEHGCRTLLFGGGVTNSQALRALFAQKATGYELLWPAPSLSLDNAAMIAGLGYHTYRQKGKGDSYDLEALTRISFGGP